MRNQRNYTVAIKPEEAGMVADALAILSPVGETDDETARLIFMRDGMEFTFRQIAELGEPR